MIDHVAELLQTIHVLRSPGGCPWDRKQTLASAAHHLLDEAAELLEAALSDDLDHTAEELADLLFMVAFCTEILHERHPADFAEIARLGLQKLIRRHPHVFGDRTAADPVESQARWNEIKAAERLARGEPPRPPGILKRLPPATAPLHQARTDQKAAAEAGFDWPDIGGVWRKLDEEIGELRQAASGGDPAAIEHEVGDLLLAVVNLARWLDVRPDIALRRANRRFRERFSRVAARFGGSPERMKAAGLDALETAWQQAKEAELANEARKNAADEQAPDRPGRPGG
jgi:MazG family protein